MITLFDTQTQTREQILLSGHDYSEPWSERWELEFDVADMDDVGKFLMQFLRYEGDSQITKALQAHYYDEIETDEMVDIFMFDFDPIEWTTIPVTTENLFKLSRYFVNRAVLRDLNKLKDYYLEFPKQILVKIFDGYLESLPFTTNKIDWLLFYQIGGQYLLNHLVRNFKIFYLNNNYWLSPINHNISPAAYNIEMKFIKQWMAFHQINSTLNQSEVELYCQNSMGKGDWNFNTFNQGDVAKILTYLRNQNYQQSSWIKIPVVAMDFLIKN